VLIAGRWNLNEYAITPDKRRRRTARQVQGVKTDRTTTRSCCRRLSVALNVFQWIGLHFESHVQFVPADELVEPVFPVRTWPQGYQEMNDSKKPRRLRLRATGMEGSATPTGTASPRRAPSRRIRPSCKWAMRSWVLTVTRSPAIAGCRSRTSRSPGTQLRLSVRRPNQSVWHYYLKSPTAVNSPRQGPSYLGATGCAGVTVRIFVARRTIEDGTKYVLPATVSSIRPTSVSVGRFAMTLRLICTS